jgi:membrane-associated phospholipid phosphatase
MEAFLNHPVLFGEEILNQLHLFIGTWFDYVMAFFTWMGNESFYMVFIPILYWCWDKKLAIYAGGAFLVGDFINVSLKNLYYNPRPNPNYLLDGIKELNIEYLPHKSPGFPSGHAQDSMVFWGALALYTRKRPVIIAAAAFILLISYSRLYLAVHYLGDVLSGLLFGALVLAASMPVRAFLEKRYDDAWRTLALAFALMVPFVLFVINPGFEVGKILGVISGFLAGVILEHEKIGFTARGSLAQSAVKIAIGFAGIVLFRYGLKAILPHGEAGDYIRFWVLGIWITFLAPYVFALIPRLGARESQA